jgi:hypothetical protein
VPIRRAALGLSGRVLYCAESTAGSQVVASGKSCLEPAGSIILGRFHLSAVPDGHIISAESSKTAGDSGFRGGQNIRASESGIGRYDYALSKFEPCVALN